MLMKTLTYWYKTFSDHSSNTIAVHEDLANLYPANEPYSVAVAMLNNSAKVFQEAPAAVDELKKAFEAPIADLLAKLHDLANKAHDRQIARAEIKYYQEKVAALANDAHSATDSKKQNKAESNNAKCVRSGGGGGGGSLRRQLLAGHSLARPASPPTPLLLLSPHFPGSRRTRPSSRSWTRSSRPRCTSWTQRLRTSRTQPLASSCSCRPRRRTPCSRFTAAP
jgi:hypothetical protein